MDKLPEHLFKVLTLEGWQESEKRGYLIPGSIDTDFIHLALPDQLEKVQKKFWATVPFYMIVKVDPKEFLGTLKYEFNPGGTSKYYHLYNGEIPLSAVIETYLITCEKK